MSYISHEDYKNLMSKFQAETPKGMLKEAVEEKKELTPRQKKFAALAPPKDKITYADKMAGIKKGMNEGDDEVDKKLERIADLHKGKKIDFETIERIAKALEGQGHEVNARYVQQFLSQRGVGMNEYGYADKYPGSWEEGKERRSATGRGMREGEGEFEVGKYLGKNTYEIIRPDGKVSQVKFHNEIEDAIDPPYVYSGWISGEDGDYNYTIEADFVDMGGGDYDEEPYFDTLEVQKINRTVTERSMRESHKGMDQWYDDFRAAVKDEIYKNIKITDKRGTLDKVKKALNLVNITDKYADRKADDAAKDFVTNLDFILAHPNKNEGLHMPPLQATGQTIDTVEENSVIDAPFGVANPGMKKQLAGPGLQLSNLTTDERKQLGEFVEAINTTKKAIEELLEKASGKKLKVKETMGGNHSSGLVMKPTTVSENAEDTEKRVSSEPHIIFKKLIKALKDEGLDDMDIQMFIKHEMEEIGKEAVMGMHDPY